MPFPSHDACSFIYAPVFQQALFLSGGFSRIFSLSNHTIYGTFHVFLNIFPGADTFIDESLLIFFVKFRRDSNGNGFCSFHADSMLVCKKRVKRCLQGFLQKVLLLQCSYTSIVPQSTMGTTSPDYPDIAESLRSKAVSTIDNFALSYAYNIPLV